MGLFLLVIMRGFTAFIIGSWEYSEADETLAKEILNNNRRLVKLRSSNMASDALLGSKHARRSHTTVQETSSAEKLESPTRMMLVRLPGGTSYYVLLAYSIMKWRSE